MVLVGSIAPAVSRRDPRRVPSSQRIRWLQREERTSGGHGHETYGRYHVRAVSRHRLQRHALTDRVPPTRPAPLAGLFFVCASRRWCRTVTCTARCRQPTRLQLAPVRLVSRTSVIRSHRMRAARSAIACTHFMRASHRLTTLPRVVARAPSVNDAVAVVGEKSQDGGRKSFNNIRCARHVRSLR